MRSISPESERLDDDRLERDAVLEQALDVGAGHVRHHRRAHLLLGEVEDRLLARGELDRALAQTADRLGHAERALESAARDVAVHADRGDEPDALLVAGAHLRTEHARCDHAEVAVGREAVERERVAARHDREAVGRAPELRASGITSSGTRTHTMSAPDASGTSPGAKPSVAAWSRDASARTHTCTSKPESRRLSAHERPWFPYPTTATVDPSIAARSASSSW